MVVAIACATLMASCGSTEKKATEQKKREAEAEAYLAEMKAKIEIISTPIDFEKDYSVRSGTVINRIKDIRKAEQQFKSKHNHFTADFDNNTSAKMNELESKFAKTEMELNKASEGKTNALNKNEEDVFSIFNKDSENWANNTKDPFK